MADDAPVDHPLVAYRDTPTGREPYVLGSGFSVAELVALARASGGIQAASQTSGIAKPLLDAAVAYANAHGADRVPVPKEADGPGFLELATKFVGLFAGIATLVYLAGGVVLAVRLALDALPWEPVIGQLPREFVLSTGAGQVMLPALLVGGLYALFRLLRRGKTNPPRVKRWRNATPRERWGVALSYAWIALVLLLPGAVVVLIREVVDGGRDPELLLWLFIGYAVMLIPASAVHEVRAVIASKFPGRWDEPLPVALTATLFTVAAVPAFTAVGAAVPLNQAKVCATGDFEELGALVGQAGDRVYLGEADRLRRRRLAVFPLTQVEELFIGSDARYASCDFDDPRLALIADERAAAAEAATERLTAITNGIGAPRLEGFEEAVGDAVTELRTTALAALDTADAAPDLGAQEAEAARSAGNDALDVLAVLEAAAADAEDRTKRTDVVAAVREAEAIASQAAKAARAAADDASQQARRRQPPPG